MQQVIDFYTVFFSGLHTTFTTSVDYVAYNRNMFAVGLVLLSGLCGLYVYVSKEFELRQVVTAVFHVAFMVFAVVPELATVIVLGSLGLSIAYLSIAVPISTLLVIYGGIGAWLFHTPSPRLKKVYYCYIKREKTFKARLL